jgi:hypothetical protein
MSRFDSTFCDYTAPSGWRLSSALEALDIITEPFDHERNAGADGYSYDRTLAINPQARLWSVPVIAAHELAHIVLGHTEFIVHIEDNGLPKSAIPFAQFELEAHQVAKAVGYGLQLTDAEFSVDLVQQYIDAFREVTLPLDDTDAIRLSRAVLTILDAGEAYLKVDVDTLAVVG